MMIDLPIIRLVFLRLELEAQTSIQLPPFKGSALRGGFGHVFKRVVCVQPSATYCDDCPLVHNCAYSLIFETRSSPDSEVLRKNQAVPVPFIVEPPLDRRTRFERGENLTFGLTLVGQAIGYLHYFLVAFRTLGEMGLGKDHGKYVLQNVQAIHPITDVEESIYYHERLVKLPTLEVTTDQINSWSKQYPVNRITLNFLTPTRLKHQGRWMMHGPPFEVLIKTLLGRISSLSYFHCGQQFEADFRGLIDRAAKVKIARKETHWEDWERFSGRQKQRIKMGGLMGRVTYAGDLQEYLPLLALGELVHVGKGTVFGNGQYQIVSE